MTTTNPTATITNNLGFDVDIYDVFNPNASAGTPGLLTYTKLATVPNGATAQSVQTIHFASQLQAMVTGNIASLNNNYYQQFPVAVMPVSAFTLPNAFTLTTAMEQAMVESFQFIKYSQANPSSAMATSFQTALGNTTSQANAVNAFFKSTVSFKQCTMSTWTAVFSWQAQFTNPWQGTYYLYSLGSTTTSGTTSTVTSAPALVATLAILATAQASSAVLTMAPSGNENTPVVMVGDGTMQEQNPGTGNLSVALTPTWLNITQTSQQNGQTVTTYVISAAFTGAINGVKVSGNINQLAIPSSSDTSQNATDKTLANIFSISSVTELVGMLTSIGMLFYMAKGHKAAEDQKKNDVQKDSANKTESDKSQQKVEDDYQRAEVPLVRNKAEQVQADDVLQVDASYEQVDQAANIQGKESAVAEQIDQLTEVMEIGAPSQVTENTAESLLEARQDLEEAAQPTTSATGRDAAVTEATTTLTSTATDLNKELANDSSQFTKQEGQALTKTEDAINAEGAQAEEVTKAQEELQEQDKNDGNEDVNDGEFGDATAQDPGPVEGA